MDNRKIRIDSEGRKAFEHAMHLLFDNAPGGKASYFAIVEPQQEMGEYDNTEVVGGRGSNDGVVLA